MPLTFLIWKIRFLQKDIFIYSYLRNSIETSSLVLLSSTEPCYNPEYFLALCPLQNPEIIPFQLLDLPEFCYLI